MARSKALDLFSQLLGGPGLWRSHETIRVSYRCRDLLACFSRPSRNSRRAGAGPIACSGVPQNKLAPLMAASLT